MLEREEIEKRFFEYCGKFDKADERIALKILHSKNVAAFCDDISKSLNLDTHSRFIAWTAGLLHDIGRFAQAGTNTFIDSIENDHANMGTDYLYGGRNLEHFVGNVTTEERLLLWLSIMNHNKLSSDTLSDEQELMCNIVRDADKLDFFRIFTVNSFEVVHEASKETIRHSAISDIVADAFFRHETIDFSTRKTPADIFISNVALPFGLVFPYSKKKAAADGYVQKMLDFEFSDKKTQETYKRMQKEMLEFLVCEG